MGPGKGYPIAEGAVTSHVLLGVMTHGLFWEKIHPIWVKYRTNGLLTSAESALAVAA